MCTVLQEGLGLQETKLYWNTLQSVPSGGELGGDPARVWGERIIQSWHQYSTEEASWYRAPYVLHDCMTECPHVRMCVVRRPA